MNDPIQQVAQPGRAEALADARRVLRAVVVLGILTIPVGGFLGGTQGILAASAGALLAAINVWALTRLADVVLFGARNSAGMWVGLALKGGGLLAAVGIIGWSFRADLTALTSFALGLSAPVAAALASPLFLQRPTLSDEFVGEEV